MVRDLKVSSPEVLSGGDSAPGGHMTVSKGFLVVSAGGGVLVPPTENGPRVCGGGRSPALDPGGGESGFEPGALASELRLVRPVDSSRAEWPGLPVYWVLSLASLTPQRLLKSASCVQGSE